MPVHAKGGRAWGLGARSVRAGEGRRARCPGARAAAGGAPELVAERADEDAAHGEGRVFQAGGEHRRRAAPGEGQHKPAGAAAEQPARVGPVGTRGAGRAARDGRARAHRTSPSARSARRPAFLARSQRKSLPCRISRGWLECTSHVSVTNWSSASAPVTASSRSKAGDGRCVACTAEPEAKSPAASSAPNL